jgi:23S rRNA (adenine2503-C2)-methyltransferase
MGGSGRASRDAHISKSRYGAPGLSQDKCGGSSPSAQNDNSVVAGNLGDGYKRATICISSQVGCAVNCQFCLTAKLGIRRNLTAGEIAGQVAAVLNRQRVRIGSGKGVDTPSRINLVFMGMGEPFLNYDAFMQSVHVLRAMGIPESRMTVSTSGIEPSIRRFAEEPVRPKLALSLNASNDAVRREIMPITKKWDIAALLAAVGSIPLGKREYVTFEYVLLGGVNDQPEHAREVLALLKGMKAKVNLIVWNPGPGIAYHQPKPEDVAVFHRMLIDGGIPTFTRRPRGRDIFAACGQLKRTVDGPALVEIL